MVRVDFYVLADGGRPERFICGLAGKALQGGNRIFIHTTQDDMALTLDDMLWTSNDISFIPHALLRDNPPPDCPVLIGEADASQENFDVLINLSDEVPAAAERCSRVVEIVAGSEEKRQLARSRYREYRDREFELHNHTIDKV